MLNGVAPASSRYNFRDDPIAKDDLEAARARLRETLEWFEVNPICCVCVCVRVFVCVEMW